MNEVKNIRSMTEATCSLSLKIYENNMNGKSSNEISFNSLFYYIYSEVYLKFVYLLNI